MKISYAQNFEDVLLARALKHVEKGFYIDVGAQHPVVDSVSMAFYEMGWRGLHIEPVPQYAALLREHRPDETVLQVVVAANGGARTLYEFPDTGLSTMDAEIAERHRKAGYRANEITVAALPLASILDSIGEKEVHWLKIDVEGAEEEVLRSWAPSTVRPWIVVVESTLPRTPEQSHEQWEPVLQEYGYVFTFFDGLNRYYVAEGHPELRTALSTPANVFDGFQLSGTSSWSRCADIETRFREQLSDLEKAHQTHLESVHAERAALQQLLDEQASRSQWQDEEISTLRSELAKLATDLRTGHEHQQALESELARARSERLRAEQEAKERSATLEEQLSRTLEALRSQTKAQSYALALTRRLVANHQAQLSEMARAHLQREQDMRRRFEAQLDELTRRLDTQSAQSEAVLSALRAQAEAHNFAQQQIDARLACLHERIEAQPSARTGSLLGRFLRGTGSGSSRSGNCIEAAGEVRFPPASAVSDAVPPALSRPQLRTTNSSEPASAAEGTSGEIEAVENEEPDMRLGTENMLMSTREEFLTSAYTQLLGREPDPEGRRYYLDRLNSGHSRAWVVSQLLRSPEYRSRRFPVHSAPISFQLEKLSDLPLVGHLFAAINLLIYGTGRWTACSSGVSTAPQSPHENYHLDDLLALSDKAFLEEVYKLFLRREVDGPGAAHYESRLKEVGRVPVLLDIYFSSEARKLGKSYKIQGARAAQFLRKLFFPKRSRRNTPNDAPPLKAGRLVGPSSATEWERENLKPTAAIPWRVERSSEARTKTVLLLTTYPIRTPRHGGQHRAANIAEHYTSAGFTVYPAGVLGSDLYPLEPGFDLFPTHQRLARYIDPPFLMDDWAIGQMYADDTHAFERLCHLIPVKPDIIHVELPWLVAFANKFNREHCQGQAKLIYGSQNIESTLKEGIVRQYRGTQAAEDSRHRVHLTELSAISVSDAVICVSEHDARWIQERIAARIVVAPNGVADSSPDFFAIRKAAEIAGNHQYALYCASAHPPNISGFLELLGGGLGSLSPRQKIIIVGSAGPHIANSETARKSRSLSNALIVAGEQDSSVLSALISGAHCMLLPITLGGGTNLKTAEALWAGKHIVATSKALRGFESYIDAQGVRIADDAPSYKRALFDAMQEAPLCLDESERHRRQALLWSHALAPLGELARALIEQKVD